MTTDDGTGQPSHSIAVYLQRGRVLLGVYFSYPDTPPSVAGKTTMADIVLVFVARLAALPASVVARSVWVRLYWGRAALAALGALDAGTDFSSSIAAGGAAGAGADAM